MIITLIALTGSRVKRKNKTTAIIQTLSVSENVIQKTVKTVILKMHNSLTAEIIKTSKNSFNLKQ